MRWSMRVNLSTAVHGIQASALTNQQLLKQRLITPAVYVLLIVIGQTHQSSDGRYYRRPV